MSTRRFTIISAAAFAAAAWPGAAPAADLDDMVFVHAEVEQLEYRAGDGADVFAWSANAWIGNDDHRLAFKAEGEDPVGKPVEASELQFLYRRPISDFFDVNVGVRHDLEPQPERTYGVIGIQGLAKQFIETDASLFVSETGDVSMRLEAEVEWLVTQKLVLQPLVELNVAFSEDAAIESGAGVNDLEAGLRLQYHVTRKFAPYVGIHWEKKFGATANHAREGGEDTESLFAVAGIHFWF